MKPATTSRRLLEETKLLVLSGGNSVEHTKVGRLDDFLGEGDLLVINRSATLPSSFQGIVQRTGEAIEIRLAAFRGPSPDRLENWFAFSFGAGSWRDPTEERGDPPLVSQGDVIWIGENLEAMVIGVQHDCLLSIQFRSSSLQKSLYEYGKPIQYSYLDEELNNWDQQTIFAGPPISVEPPSAGFALTWEMIFKLRQKGVKVVSLLHGAGISSTGSSDLDGLLPLEEWYEIPEETVDAIHEAKKAKRKIVALGTTVLRALESSGRSGELDAGKGLTKLKITPGYEFKFVSSLISGMHELGTSHMEILNSFCPVELVKKGYGEAIARGYEGHEYGDLSFFDCYACK